MASTPGDFSTATWELEHGKYPLLLLGMNGGAGWAVPGRLGLDLQLGQRQAAACTQILSQRLRASRLLAPGQSETLQTPTLSVAPL